MTRAEFFCASGGCAKQCINCADEQPAEWGIRQQADAAGEPEPVAWALEYSYDGDYTARDLYATRDKAEFAQRRDGGVIAPLYTAPPADRAREQADRIAALEAEIAKMRGDLNAARSGAASYMVERDEALSLAHSRALVIEGHEAFVRKARNENDDLWGQAILDVVPPALFEAIVRKTAERHKAAAIDAARKEGS